MSWQEIPREIKAAQEIRRLAGEFEIELDGPAEKVRVRVYEGRDGRYIGVSNYRVQAEGATTPSRRTSSQLTVEGAIVDSLRGLTALSGPGAQWFKDEDY